MVKLPYQPMVILPLTEDAKEVIHDLQETAAIGKCQFSILEMLFFYNVPISQSMQVPVNEMHFLWGENLSVFQTRKYRPTGENDLGVMPRSPSLHQ